LSKFGALYKNEMIKIFHKKALVVVIAITLLAVFAVGMFVKAFEDSVFDSASYSGITKGSVEGSIDRMKENIKSDKVAESADRLHNAIEKYDADYGDDVNYYALAQDIAKLSVYYESAINGKYLSYPMTEDNYDYLMNSAAILEYRIEECREEYLLSNSEDELNTQVTRVMMMIIFSINIVLIIILAGSSISHEISSGSIKSLIIAPVKRAKIFWAKFLSVLTVGLCVYLIEYLLICLYCMILFGFDNSFFAFISGSNIYSMSVYLKNLIIILISYIVMISFAAIAIMLSSVSRNTAASVGGSMGIYYAGTVATSVLSYFINPIFIKYIPFTHFQALSEIELVKNESRDVLNLIFRYAQNGSYSFFRSNADSGFAFSVIYVVIFTAIMLWIARDSFIKRDI